MKVAIPEKITVEMTEEEREAFVKTKETLMNTYNEIFKFAVENGYKYFKCYDKDTHTYYTIKIDILHEVTYKIEKVLEITELINYRENYTE